MSWFNLSAPAQITSCITMNGDGYNSEVAMIIEHSIWSSRVTEVAGVSPLILADVRFEMAAPSREKQGVLLLLLLWAPWGTAINTKGYSYYYFFGHPGVR